ncbi:MAG: amidase, partial [Rhodovibrionaceae bacterium]
LVFAKTNCPEWGAGGNTTNPVYGASGNPFAPELTCGGSSGGSAIALATGMMPLAHGSDNAGSLRIPASFCGVVGFRPSHGLVPSERRAMGASPFMLEGPMGRDVADTQLMLRGLLSDDSRDYLAGPVDPALHRPLEPLDISELRIAVSEDLGFAPIEDGLRATFQSRIEPLRALFASARDADPDFTEVDRTYDILRAVSYIASWGERYKEWGEKVGPLVDANMKSALAYGVEDVGWAYAQQTRLYQEFQAFFAGCDLLLCPTMGVYPWPKEVLFPTEVNGRPMRNYFHYVAMTYGITLMGHPAISIPCGRDDRGLPFGLQIVGPRHGDLLVLRAAKALEAIFAERSETARPLPDLKALESPAS